jgi:hypothetical protein
MAMLVLPVCAATTINTYEKSIIDKLAAGVVVGTKTVVPSAAVLNIARNFFMMDGVDFTQADATAILHAIDDIFAVVKASGVSDLTMLSLDDKDTIEDMAQAAVLAVQSISLSFQYDVTTHIASILGPNEAIMAQHTIASTSTVIKRTGLDLATSFLLISLLGLTMMAGIAITSKNKLLRSKV